MERLKRYDIIGIVDPDLGTKYDVHDKRVMSSMTRSLKKCC